MFNDIIVWLSSLDGAMSLIVVVVMGTLIDAIVGDPHKMPHPIRLFGNMIAWGEKRLNKGTNRRTKGMLMALTLMVLTFVAVSGIRWLASMHWFVLLAVDIVLFAYAISTHSLIYEAWKVERLVRAKQLDEARVQLSYIVGRDTTNLSLDQIRIATLETLAENLSDGIIAPLFFFMIGGTPLMLTYKMVNTMDSMIGYKSPRYKEFGFFAARILDDSANYIPSRLTALIIATTHASARSLRFIRLFARKHSSPNAGYPESAMAGVLDCRFGGPNIYHGELVEKPYIGENNRPTTAKDFTVAATCVATTALTMTLFVIIILWVTPMPLLF